MKLHTLKNGIRVIFEERENTNSVFISVAVDIGSNHETEKENGIAHFLEHMFFKGTKRFPKSEDLSTAIDKTGAYVNAGTGRTDTEYYFFGEKNGFRDMTTLVADMFLNSILKEEEIEKEKGVIIQEIQMYKDTAYCIADDELHQNVLKGTSAARSVIGTEEIIKKFASKDFLAFRKKHYKSKNTIITVVGNVSEEIALSTIEELFNEVPEEDKSEQIIFTKEQIGIDKKHSSILREQDNQMQLLISFPFPTLNIEDSWTAAIFNVILGEGFSSRLFSSIREKAGACYSIKSVYYENNFGIGVSGLNISTGIDSGRAEEVTRLIKKELDLIKANGVTKDEVEIAKAIIINSLARRESNSQIARRYTRELVENGAIQSYEDIIKDIKKVTVEKVGIMANRLLKGDNAFVVYVGNKEIPENISQCLREV